MIPDILIGSGKDAVSGIQSGCHNESVDKVIEAVVLMSGLGAENCGCGIAHSPIPEIKNLNGDLKITSVSTLIKSGDLSYFIA